MFLSGNIIVSGAVKADQVTIKKNLQLQYISGVDVEEFTQSVLRKDGMNQELILPAIDLHSGLSAINLVTQSIDGILISGKSNDLVHQCLCHVFF